MESSTFDMSVGPSTIRESWVEDGKEGLEIWKDLKIGAMSSLRSATAKAMSKSFDLSSTPAKSIPESDQLFDVLSQSFNREDNLTKVHNRSLPRMWKSEVTGYAYTAKGDDQMTFTGKGKTSDGVEASYHIEYSGSAYLYTDPVEGEEENDLAKLKEKEKKKTLDSVSLTVEARYTDERWKVVKELVSKSK